MDEILYSLSNHSTDKRCRLMNEDELKSLNLILGFIECILSNETNENKLNELLV